MLKDENIICISSIDWDFVWQGHQEIMSTLAENGNRVLFIENTGIRAPAFKDIPRLKKRISNWFQSTKGFRRERDNLYVYSPLVLPFPYSRIARWINRYLLQGALDRWMEAMEFYKPIIWTFLPTGTALDIINNIEKKLLIYYCIADFYELADSPKKVRKTEDALIKKSDLIFVQGEVLRDKCIKLNKNVFIFPFGVKIEVFNNFIVTPEAPPKEMRGLKKPIIGYIGGLHRHIDFALIRCIAHAHPEWSIVLVGPVQTDVSEVSDLKNVFLLGKKDFLDLPKYIAEFSVSIIPYIINEYTITVFPTKLNEYHAMGKPVVSTALPEVLNFNKKNDNLVLVAKTYQEFEESIVKAIDSDGEELKNKRKANAKKDSWTARIEEMSNLIEYSLDKKYGNYLNWQERFLKFYSFARRKLLKTIAIFLSIYLLIFYTPVIWFIAKPLKINQSPVKADCIVVFAGGVGESGKAGQGYEERVHYAAQLYNRGFAKHMIFSSGYKYVYEEPTIMKTLALSEGVPQEAIILEDKARNTYENVKFTKKILDGQKWNKVLLVSSPYHMLRVSLVVNKVAPSIMAIYTPITESDFYKHKGEGKAKIFLKQVSLQQIKALVHEYLGILYYWWKGYI